jgi:hypothetical protein
MTVLTPLWPKLASIGGRPKVAGFVNIENATNLKSSLQSRADPFSLNFTCLDAIIAFFKKHGFLKLGERSQNPSL